MIYDYHHEADILEVFFATEEATAAVHLTPAITLHFPSSDVFCGLVTELGKWLPITTYFEFIYINKRVNRHKVTKKCSDF